MTCTVRAKMLLIGAYVVSVLYSGHSKMLVLIFGVGYKEKAEEEVLRAVSK